MLTSVRSGLQVDSQGGDENYEALSKYAVDLTAKAESLDPVRSHIPADRP